MPTETVRQFFTPTHFVFNGGDLIDTFTRSDFLDTYVLTIPATVSRKKPVDLFAGSTARTTTSVIQNCATISSGYPSGTDTIRITGQKSASFWSTSHGKDPALPVIDVEAIYNQIRSNIRGDAVNLAMAVAEYRQTAALFGSLARAVSSKGKSLAAALKTKKGVSKTWLGFQYGVKPLVSDILGSIDNLKNACDQPVYLHGVESRKARDMLRSDVRSLSTYYDIPGQLESHAQKQIRVKWRAKYNPNPVYNTIVAHGFSNPFSLAYELIPFSFVIDWWINVGDMLSSLDNLLLFDKLEIIKSERVVRARYITSPGYIRSNGRSFVDPHHWTRITRSDTRGSPSTISLIASPKYKPSVSLTHILNGLALLHVTRGRFPSTHGR